MEGKKSNVESGPFFLFHEKYIAHLELDGGNMSQKGWDRAMHLSFSTDGSFPDVQVAGSVGTPIPSKMQAFN